MRISQLSAESGVPIPTIKYYLREGLLPQGEQTAATRAEYGESHVRRLRLIRALIEVGRLSLASIQRVIAAVEDEDLPVHEMLGTAAYALSPPVNTAASPKPAEEHQEDEEWHRAREQVDRLISDMGWQIHPLAPTRDELAHTLISLDRLALPGTSVDLRPYATLALQLARDHEMRKIPFDGPRDVAVETMVVFSVLYGRALDVLRRLAHESESARILGVPPYLPR